MQLNTVVLPAPFGPISAVTSPRADPEGEVVDRDEAAEAHRQVFDGEDGIFVPECDGHGLYPWPSFTRSPEIVFRSNRKAVG